ncbi:hypothetical protein KPH14_011505 [Odynerus spinipes]|uniref:T-box domain-containing protein n=1 Tax=Odynerus spinipes TaxID=1348599 RepID=A0AAD9RJH5_9HYME|nr:hypothetical protein KPH14_011505 [Odynerus spinipes]
MPAKGERGKATDFSIAAIMAPRGPSFGHYHLQGIGNAATGLECPTTKGFVAGSTLDHRARTSPVNILATATVVTEEALLGEEEVENCEGESVATEKSTNEEDEEVDVDVDVEECSSLEDGPVHGLPDDLSIGSSSSSSRKYDGNGGAPGCNEHHERKHRLRTSCNSDELRDVECQLETKDLWDKFNELGTEMIITKTGRYETPIYKCIDL